MANPACEIYYETIGQDSSNKSQSLKELNIWQGTFLDQKKAKRCDREMQCVNLD